jgi:hypothetical protein
MIVEAPMICAISAGTDAFFNFLFCKSVLNNGEHLFVLNSRASGINFVYEDLTTFATIRAIVPLPARINVASALICTQAAVDGTITIYRVEVGPDAGFVIDAVDSTRSYQGVFCLSLDTIAPATWNTDGSTTLKVARDKIDGGLIFFIGRSSSDGAYVFKWIEDQGVVWTTQVDSGVPVGDVSFTCGSRKCF